VSLRAPIAVTVEVRAAGRRVFRLAANVGEDGIALERPAPFEIGRPVEVAFGIPDDTEGLRLFARVEAGHEDDEEAGDDGPGGAGGRELIFLSIDPSDRERLRGYVTDRLGLPEMPG
jgi:hypothetical protein